MKAQFIAFQKFGQGWGRNDNLIAFAHGTKDECIEAILRNESGIFWVADQDRFNELALEMSEGTISDLGFENCSEHWKLKWYSAKTGLKFDGEGFYDFDNYVSHGNSLDDDLDRYYFETIDNLSETEVGEVIESDVLYGFDYEELAKIYGEKDENEVLVVECRVNYRKHNGTFNTTRYFQNGVFSEKYPELEKTD